MADDQAVARPPSVWVFTALAAGSCLTPLINRGLGDPISGKMNAMLVVAAIAFPASSLIYLLGKTSARDKVAVFLTWLCGACTLLWVDWDLVDVRVVMLASALFLVPTLIRLATLGGRGGGRRPV